MPLVWGYGKFDDLVEVIPDRAQARCDPETRAVSAWIPASRACVKTLGGCHLLRAWYVEWCIWGARERNGYESA